MDGNNDPKKKYFDIAPPPPQNTPPPDRPTVGPGNRQMINRSDDSPPANYPPAKDNVFGTAETVQDTLMEPEESNEGSEDTVSHPAFTISSAEDEKSQSVEEPEVEIAEKTEEESAEEPITEPEEEPEEVPAQEKSGVVPEPNIVPVESATIDTGPEQGLLANDLEPAEEPVATSAVEITDNANLAGETVVEPPKSPEVMLATAETISPEANEPVEPPKPEPENKDIPASPPERFAVTDSLPDPGENAANAAKEGMQDPKVSDTKEYYVPIGEVHHGHGSLKGAFIFGIICAVIIVGAVVFIMIKIGSK